MAFRSVQLGSVESSLLSNSSFTGGKREREGGANQMNHHCQPKTHLCKEAHRQVYYSVTLQNRGDSLLRCITGSYPNSIIRNLHNVLAMATWWPITMHPKASTSTLGQDRSGYGARLSLGLLTNILPGTSEPVCLCLCPAYVLISLFKVRIQ